MWVLLGRHRAPDSVGPGPSPLVPLRFADQPSLFFSDTPGPEPMLLPQLGKAPLSPQVSVQTCLPDHTHQLGPATHSCSPMRPVIASPHSVPGTITVSAQCRCLLGGTAITAAKVPPEWGRILPAKYLESWDSLTFNSKGKSFHGSRTEGTEASG